ncbi:MAG: hypothetical protein KAT58_05510 [candidate division Zixibacteria bacterium]|nr:hypothetical protein [candidate division Zixibacteria bacterium]
MAKSHLQLKVLDLDLKSRFTLSGAAATKKTTLLACWHDGIGEGSPSIHYGLTADQLLDSLLSPAKDEIELSTDKDLLELLQQLPQKLNVARCALEMAYLDYQAKLQARPLYNFLGLPKPQRVESSLTISNGTDREISEQIERAADFNTLKLKVGFDGDLSFIDKVLALREVKLRLDANGGWHVDQAVERLKSLSGYPIEFVEQPLITPDLFDLDQIKSRVDVPLFLDESIIAENDIHEYQYVIDGVNLKAAKCGGLQNTIAMARLAREYGLQLLLGCMIETAIGITAALHIASLFDCYDLDALLLTANDPFRGAYFEGCKLLLPERKGIGVEYDDDIFA